MEFVTPMGMYTLLYVIDYPDNLSDRNIYISTRFRIDLNLYRDK